MDGGGKQLFLAGGNVGWQAVVEARVVGGARRRGMHVWDAAAREWLLPRVAALSESKAAADALRGLIARMLEPDPSKRPAFPELLEELT